MDDRWEPHHLIKDGKRANTLYGIERRAVLRARNRARVCINCGADDLRRESLQIYASANRKEQRYETPTIKHALRCQNCGQLAYANASIEDEDMTALIDIIHKLGIFLT